MAGALGQAVRGFEARRRLAPALALAGKRRSSVVASTLVRLRGLGPLKLQASVYEVAPARLRASEHWLGSGGAR